MRSSGKEIPEVEVECEDDTTVAPSQGKNLIVGKTVKRLLAQVKGVMSTCPQQLEERRHDDPARRRAVLTAGA